MHVPHDELYKDNYGLHICQEGMLVIMIIMRYEPLSVMSSAN